MKYLKAFFVAIFSCLSMTYGQQSQPNTLTILQYNIQQRPSSEGMKYEMLKKHSTRSRLSTVELPKAITQFKADVVTVNEAFTGSLRPELIKEMAKIGYTHHTDVANRYDKGSSAWTSGVMIFSKYPIIKTKDLKYSTKGTVFTNADVMAAKGAQYVQIDKNGMKYNIFATHPNASYKFDQSTGVPLDDIGRASRRIQFQELRAFIDQQNIPSNQPVIIVGDMNVEMHTEQRRPQENDNEYKYMLSTLNATHIPQTGHTFSTDDQTNEWAKGGKRYLDYALYANDHQKPKKASGKVLCLKQNGKVQCVKDNKVSRDLSDHYPLLAEFTF